MRWMIDRPSSAFSARTARLPEASPALGKTRPRSPTWTASQWAFSVSLDMSEGVALTVPIARPFGTAVAAYRQETEAGAFMIEGQDIICFSNDWDGDPLSKKHIMQRLARRNRVLWVNSIGNRNPTASLNDFRRIVKKLMDFTRGSRRVAEGI